MNGIDLIEHHRKLIEEAEGTDVWMEAVFTASEELRTAVRRDMEELLDEIVSFTCSDAAFDSVPEYRLELLEGGWRAVLEAWRAWDAGFEARCEDDDTRMNWERRQVRHPASMERRRRARINGVIPRAYEGELEDGLVPVSPDECVPVKHAMYWLEKKIRAAETLLREKEAEEWDGAALMLLEEAQDILPYVRAVWEKTYPE